MHLTTGRSRGQRALSVQVPLSRPRGCAPGEHQAPQPGTVTHPRMCQRPPPDQITWWLWGCDFVAHLVGRHVASPAIDPWLPSLGQGRVTGPNSTEGPLVEHWVDRPCS